MRDLGRICLSADLSNLDKLKDFVRVQLVLLNFSYEQSLKIELACDEIITNIISYAYPEKGGDVVVHCRALDQKTLLVNITDQGVAYNPLEVAPPDLEMDVEDRLIGGLGLFFVQQMVDDIVYTRQDNSNILALTFQKQIDGDNS